MSAFISSQSLQRAYQYIVNVGGITEISRFNDDFEPIGPLLIEDLVRVGLVEKSVGWLTIKSSTRQRAALIPNPALVHDFKPRGRSVRRE